MNGMFYRSATLCGLALMLTVAIFHNRPNTPLVDQVTEPVSKCMKPRFFVGVFTDGSGAAKYIERRAALRASWFPSSPAELQYIECTYGITLRFVVGNGELTDDLIDRKAWHDELSAHDDFLRLNVLDTYPAMSGKTFDMFRHVLNLPEEYQYAVKIDDDMFVSLPHLSKVIEQWAAMKVDYIGCMSHPGVINRTIGHKWYEPLHDILAPSLHMYACGHTYALSRTAMTHVFKEGDTSNRFLAVEDQAMGMWMMAHNVTYFEDRRLCASRCHSSQAFAAVNYGKHCNGLTRPLIHLHELHANPECHAAPPRELPFLQSKFERFNKMIRAYPTLSSGGDQV